MEVIVPRDVRFEKLTAQIEICDNDQDIEILKLWFLYVFTMKFPKLVFVQQLLEPKNSCLDIAISK